MEEVLQYTHQCLICEKTFHTSGSLNRHLRALHNLDYADTITNRNLGITCSLCSSKFFIKKKYEEHLASEHNITIEKESLTFPSEPDFLAWKENIQAATYSLFVKRRGSKKSGDGSVAACFYCFRSGQYREMEGKANEKRKRGTKSLGSNKLNAKCPAMLKVTYLPDETVDVVFVKTHVGHDTNDDKLGRLPLTEEEKKIVAEKLANKIPVPEILDSARTSCTEGEMGRFNLLSRQDIFNIQKKLDIKYDVTCDLNDSVSTPFGGNVCEKALDKQTGNDMDLQTDKSTPSKKTALEKLICKNNTAKQVKPLDGDQIPIIKEKTEERLKSADNDETSILKVKILNDVKEALQRFTQVEACREFSKLVSDSIASIDAQESLRKKIVHCCSNPQKKIKRAKREAILLREQSLSAGSDFPQRNAVPNFPEGIPNFQQSLPNYPHSHTNIPQRNVHNYNAQSHPNVLQRTLPTMIVRRISYGTPSQLNNFISSLEGPI